MKTIELSNDEIQTLESLLISVIESSEDMNEVFQLKEILKEIEDAK